MINCRELYPQLPALIERVQRTNADDEEATSAIVHRVKHLTDDGQMRIGVESLLDVIADGDVKILFDDFLLLMQLSGCVGSTRYSWNDFAPEGSLMTR